MINLLGEPSGLLVDLWRNWSKKSGISITFVATHWRGTLAALQRGDADIHSGLFMDQEQARWMAFSDPLHELSSALFYRMADMAPESWAHLKDQGVGVVAGSFLESDLKRKHPEIRILAFQSATDALHALMAGKMRALFIEELVMEALKDRFALRGEVGSVHLEPSRHQLRAAVRKEQAHLLLAINQGMDRIPRQQRIAMENRWIRDPAKRIWSSPSVRMTLSRAERNWLRAHPVTRLAVVKYWPPYDQMDEQQRHTGLHADVIQHINRHLGIQVMAVPFKSWKHAYDAAARGQVDGIMGLSRTSEREKVFLFSKPYHYEPATLVVPRTRGSIRSWQDLKGRRVWFKGNASLIVKLKQDHPDAEAMEAASEAKALKALSAGQGDAYVAWLSQDHRQALEGMELKVAAYVDTPQGDFHIGINRSFPLIASILQKGLDAITVEELVQIRARWISRIPVDEKRDEAYGSGQMIDHADKTDLALTDEERAWIKAHPEIRVGNVPDWPPFEFRVDGGEATGVSVDLLSEVAKQVGLKVTFVGDAWESILKRLRETRDLDVAPGLLRTSEREQYLHFTSPTFEMFDVIYVRSDRTDIQSTVDLHGKTVAVERAYYTEEILKSRYPDVKRYPVTSTLEAIKALSTGEVDAYVGNQMVGSYLIQKHLFSNLKVTGIFEKKPRLLTMGVRKDLPILRSILDKGHSEALRLLWHRCPVPGRASQPDLQGASLAA